MKNAIIVDIDEDRDQRLQLTKPKGHAKPETEEEARTMIIHDMQTLCEGLGTLIRIADASGYVTADDSLGVCMKYFNDTFNIGNEDEDKGDA